MMLTQEMPTAPQTARRRTDWAKLFWMMKSSPLTLVGGVIIVLILLLMVLSPWITPHDPNAINLSARLLPPSAAHWFGTDEVGRDLFSRVLVGSQQSVVAGLVVVGIAGGLGSLLGCLSGVMGGRADAIIMRMMDIMLSIPSLVLTMALAAALGPRAPSTPVKLITFRPNGVRGALAGRPSPTPEQMAAWRAYALSAGLGAVLLR